MKIVCCVSHLEEPTLWACLGTIAKLEGVEFELVRLVIGKTPFAASLNAALDIAHGLGADWLLHLSSGRLLTPDAIRHFLAVADIERHHTVIGRSYEPLSDRITLGDVRLFNMRAIGEIHRFGAEPDIDQAFYDRVAEDSGLNLGHTVEERALCYVNPVWSAHDLYMQYRCAIARQPEEVRRRMEDFLSAGRTMCPDNAALKAGAMGLEAGKRSGAVDTAEMVGLDQEFRDCADKLELDGTEYYVRHKFYASLGKSILDSEIQCVCERPKLHVPLIHWR